MTSVDKLRIPLLVVIGAKGRTAWHLVGNNEGHCFAKMENIDYQFWTEVQFWKQNLLK